MPDPTETQRDHRRLHAIDGVPALNGVTGQSEQVRLYASASKACRLTCCGRLISPPKLLVLEPSLPTGDLHFPVAVATSRSSRGRPTGQKKDGPGVKDALRWLFGEEQVWDVELSEESSGSSRASIEKDGERRLIIRKTAQSI